MKMNPVADKTSAPSPYITATRARDSQPRSAQNSLSDKGEEDDILVVNTIAKNINHSKHHGKAHHVGDEEKSENGDSNIDDVHLVPQIKSSSKSRRRRKQLIEGDGDREDKARNIGGRAGNRNQRKGMEDDQGEGENEERDISAQVESLMSGQLLVNGYHKGSDGKRSPSKQSHHNSSAKPSTRAKPSGR